ncbi:MAG: muconolactone Delta-isomerase family protein [Thermaerobacter sp.]|nr:muconolactone Delta-isomerase family protein [Thermaerobacter sp.]
MLYHCQIRTSAPQMSREEWDSLLTAEAARGKELVSAGHIVGIWRVVGAMANVSIWQASSPEELHALLQSLPLHPYQEVQVTPLVVHPLMAEQG